MHKCIIIIIYILACSVLYIFISYFSYSTKIQGLYIMPLNNYWSFKIINWFHYSDKIVQLFIYL